MFGLGGAFSLAYSYGAYEGFDKSKYLIVPSIISLVFGGFTRIPEGDSIENMLD